MSTSTREKASFTALAAKHSKQIPPFINNFQHNWSKNFPNAKGFLYKRTYPRCSYIEDLMKRERLRPTAPAPNAYLIKGTVG